MVSIFYRKKTFILPGSYNELSKDQLIKLSPLLARKEDPVILSLMILKVLMGIGKIRFFFLSLDLRHRLLDHINWVFEKNTLTAQLLPSYRGMYGPKGEFDNLTLHEYHCTETFYSMYLASEDQKFLDALIAVLYRRRKNWYNERMDPDGDCRRPFNEHEIDYWAARVAIWPVAVKQAILLWYDGCRQHMISLYPKVFNPGSLQDKDTTIRGMFGVMRTLADGAKYGDFEAIKKLNLHTSLLEMEQLSDEIAELNKQS